ncbi:MAG: gliding motility-associated C-terminal domain-containing protein [Deltaproteobacteria bacterium]
MIALLLCTMLGYGQIQKIYFPQKTDWGSFGRDVGIWGDFAYIYSSDFKEDLEVKYIYKKNYKIWELHQDNIVGADIGGILYDSMLFLPNYLKNYDPNISVIYRTNSIYNITDIDSIFVGNKSKVYAYAVDNGWMVIRIFEQFFYPLNTRFIDYFYHFENDDWVLKTTNEQVLNYYPLIGESPEIMASMNEDYAVIVSQIYDPSIYGFIECKLDIFSKSGNEWKLTQQIYEPDQIREKSKIGFAVVISPDSKFIVASSTYGRKIYIFKLNKGHYDFCQNLNYSENYDYKFLNLSNSELLIGSEFGDINFPGEKMQYWRLVDSTWTRMRDIHPPITDTTYRFFGHGIDRFGETVIAGAHGDNKYGFLSGAAYIFQIPARDTITTSVCKSEGYAFGDTTYYESGTYRDTLIASYGVDSVVVLNLTVLPVYKHKLDTVLCEGQIVQIGDQVFDQSGHFTIKLTSSIGCDSTIDFTLRVIDREYPAVDTFFCNGSTISLQGQNITSGGTYSFILKNKNGCDSIISYEVHQIDPDIQKIDTSFCEEHSLMINGKQISESGIYSFDLKNRFGCDSIVSYFVTEIPVKRIKIDTLICEGESISIAGNVLNQPGRYEFKVVASSGCDSLITLELKTALKNNKSVDTVLCAGQSIKIGDQLIDEAGEYSIVLKNMNECDSTVNIRISKSELEVTNEVFSDLGCKSGRIELDVIGNKPPFYYLWNTGSTQEDLVVAEKGNYVLTVIDNTGCSYEFSFEIFDSTAYLIPEAFTPDDQNEELNRTFWIYIADQGYAKPRVKILSTEIFNRWGEKVFSSAGSNFWDGTYRSKPVQAGVYIYAIVIDTPCGIKTEKGQLLLLR